MVISGLGAKLQAYLDENDISREGIAQKLKMSYKTLERILLQDTIVKVEYLVSLSMLMEKSLDYLVYGEISSDFAPENLNTAKSKYSLEPPKIDNSKLLLNKEIEFLKKENLLLNQRIEDKDLLIEVLKQQSGIRR